MGKWELTMNPVQEWGEEFEDGAVYGVTLRREPVPSAQNTSETNPCCAFVQYRTCKVRRLKAATLDLLVNHLLDPSCQEQDYGRIFLSTYRTFTSTTKLIELLFQRDSAASDLDNSECYRSPLLTFIQTWLDEYSEDFRDPPQHLALRLLLDHLRISSAVYDNMRSQPNFCSLAGQAEALLQRFQKEEAEINARTTLADLEQEEEGSGDEDSGCENSVDQGGIMDFSTAAIAEQLTRMDSALFVKVVPYQCLGCVWSQRDKKENMSPTIRATIAQFNAITNQVIVSLLCQPADPTSSPTSSRQPPTTPAQRARIIEKWIRVAQDCRWLKNFSSLKAILSALHSNAVYRLRKTWAAVSRDSMTTFDNLCETFPDENCVLTNRELLGEDGGQASVDNISPKISKRCPIPRQMSTSSGVVPYLGTYLTVLTMLDTALPDTVEGGLINLEKRRREFEVLSQIRTLQASCSQYNLPHHSRIAAWLQRYTLLTDQESYELSRQLEPPVDLCSPTLWSHRTLTKKLSSLLTASDGSKKLPADQISVSSSGSSGSEMEDLSSPNSACSIRLQSFHSSCNNVSEAFSSLSSSSSSSPCSSAASSPDSPTPSVSSSDCQADMCSPSSSCSGARPKASHHKRSVSMTSLPVYNRQVDDSCIVRVSVDLAQSNGNMYKSILLTSQDKTAQVIKRALEKHHLEHMNWQEFTLTQVISPERELLIPDKANVFYAMSTTANFDFVLRQFPKGQRKPLRATCSLGRYTK
ncbi:ral guanine nucleotide dissociation stimulator-like 1 [Lates calcarifer]|uniref:Ral guanine nucleotide dissociation stimulator-like 1 n=1 Tax=Lates calcarifer TaxID=8187 RepID=A0A4W6EB89_LATCA|nr:ral guanine nucleotide dissociation stimulator-like 1 [Lates calcarifer]XP_018554208.1 ral guanine nucleotide dissociation stimulator-like 1 [Lates calcarifer]